MAWDSETGILTFNRNEAGRKIGVDGLADLQLALGSSKKSQIELFAVDYNRFAKFKEFKSANLFIGDNYGDTNSARLAALKGTNYGLNIVSCFRSTFAAKYADRWTLDKPTVPNFALRPMDFDGYQKFNNWQSGGAADELWTIFGGYMHTTGATVSDNDLISFNLQCRENEDLDPYLNTLYPYDFDSGCPKVLRNYYVGVAILASDSKVWVISGPRVSSASAANPYAFFSATISSSIANGAVKIVPVLLQSTTVPSGGTDPAWTSEYSGDIVNLDGAYLSATKMSGTENLETNVTFSVSGTTVTLNFTVRNRTGSNVTLHDAWLYLCSNGAATNEHDNGYDGPDFMGEGVVPYITRTWVGATSRPDVYSGMWTGGSTSPNQLAARSYNFLQELKDHNGGSNIIANNANITWSSTYNVANAKGVAGDDFGAYANGVWAFLCLAPTGNSFVRSYRQF